MKTVLFLLALFAGTAMHAQDVSKLRDGDILFQASSSPSAQAIRLATHSVWNHCGVLFFEGGKPWVYEAVQPVRRVPLAQWVAQGTGGKFAARRMKNGVLTTQQAAALRTAAAAYLGKDYDLYFGWGDEKLYCSELVWKTYATATGVKLGSLQKLRDFDLSHPLVQAKLKERYGSAVPLDEQVISPEAIWASPQLQTVPE